MSKLSAGERCPLLALTWLSPLAELIFFLSPGRIESLFVGARDETVDVCPGALAEPFMVPTIDWRDDLGLAESTEGGPIEERFARLVAADSFCVAEVVVFGGVAFPDEAVELSCLVGDLLGDCTNISVSILSIVSRLISSPPTSKLEQPSLLALDYQR